MRTKFAELFSEPVPFTDHVLAISRDQYTREEAAELFSAEDGKHCDPSLLIEHRVRFGFWTDEEGERQLTWHYPASGKGSMPIWVWK